jgi:hypothetical protein
LPRRCPAWGHGSRSRPPSLLAAILDDLALLPAGAGVGLVAWRASREDDEPVSQRFMKIGPSTELHVVGLPAPPVRGALRIWSPAGLPSALLARLAVMVGAPADAWRIPSDEPERRTTTAAISAGTAPVVDLDPDQPVVMLAQLAGLLGDPALTPGHSGPPRIGRAFTGRRERDGAQLGRVLTPDGGLSTLRVPWSQRRRHMVVCGRTGSGKSELIARLAADDLAADRGLLLLDPHGDLADRILGHVPPDRTDDVVLIEPHDERSAAIPVLDATRSSKDQMALLDDVYLELFGEGGFYTSRWRRPGRVALDMLETLEGVDSSPIGLDRVMTDDDVRFGLRTCLPADAPALRPAANTRQFWDHITFRGAALSETPGRYAFDHAPRWDLAEAIGSGKIVIARLDVGRLGTTDAGRLGRILLRRAFAAMTSLGSTARQARPPVSIIVDEAHLFSSGSILGTLLAQSRKYGCGMTLCTQAPSRLPAELRADVLTNCATALALQLPSVEARVFADRDPAAPDQIAELPKFTRSRCSTTIRAGTLRSSCTRSRRCGPTATGRPRSLRPPARAAADGPRTHAARMSRGSPSWPIACATSPSSSTAGSARSARGVRSSPSTRAPAARRRSQASRCRRCRSSRREGVEAHRGRGASVAAARRDPRRTAQPDRAGSDGGEGAARPRVRERRGPPPHQVRVRALRLAPARGRGSRVPRRTVPELRGTGVHAAPAFDRGWGLLTDTAQALASRLVARLQGGCHEQVLAACVGSEVRASRPVAPHRSSGARTGGRPRTEPRGRARTRARPAGAQAREGPRLTAPMSVIGFRAWRLDDGRLKALYVPDQTWEHGVTRAVCAEDDGHAAPHPECDCGLYALHDAPRGTSCSELVVGAVAAWGATEVHGNGFRAAAARPVVLSLPPSGRHIQARLRRLAAEHGALAVPRAHFEAAAAEHGQPLPEAMRPVDVLAPLIADLRATIRPLRWEPSVRKVGRDAWLSRLFPLALGHAIRASQRDDVPLLLTLHAALTALHAAALARPGSRGPSRAWAEALIGGALRALLVADADDLLRTPTNAPLIGELLGRFSSIEPDSSVVGSAGSGQPTGKDHALQLIEDSIDLGLHDSPTLARLWTSLLDVPPTLIERALVADRRVGPPCASTRSTKPWLEHALKPLSACCTAAASAGIAARRCACCARTLRCASASSSSAALATTLDRQGSDRHAGRHAGCCAAGPS